jgi:hypothetical protein
VATGSANQQVLWRIYLGSGVGLRDLGELACVAHLTGWGEVRLFSHVTFAFLSTLQGGGGGGVLCGGFLCLRGVRVNCVDDGVAIEGCSEVRGGNASVFICPSVRLSH